MRQRWFDKPAGPGLQLILFAVCAAAALIVLSGCSVDTTRPDYTVRLFETPEEISRRHDMRMQDWRHHQNHNMSRWKSRHGIY